MSKLTKGDTVQLKSGGPTMTIQDIGNYSIPHGIENGALCVWFDNNQPLEKIFDVEALQISKD